MKISLPSRLTFWRLLLSLTCLLVFLAVRGAFELAAGLGVAPLASRSWLGLFALLGLIGLVSLGLLAISFFANSSCQEIIFNWLEFADRANSRLPDKPFVFRSAGGLLLAAAVFLYPFLLLYPPTSALFSSRLEIRFFSFWMLALVGMQGLKLLDARLSWLVALLSSLLLQTVVLRIALYFPDVSRYPFSMGWSETSRFYYPALFLGREIFGQPLAWPILHPSLHFLLIPPYLVNAPLWFHRLWQVAIRFLLLGLVAPALLSRLKLEGQRIKWFAGLWIFLVLLTIPLYLHLAVPVIMVLWGYSSRNDRRTWFWLLLASIWAGLSRINWYPVPGLLLAALYFLEKPIGKQDGRYLLKPALWFLAGSLAAFASMQIYIAVSGINNPGDFFTSLSSSLLWFRLWPNPSYPPGVLLAVLIFSVPFWLLMAFFIKKSNLWAGVEKYRLVLLGLELLVLFIGGIFVSMKIGGGADIHNMDAYLVLLLVISTYWLAQIWKESGNAQTFRAVIPWGLIALLILVPAWFGSLEKAQFWQYNPETSRVTLSALQQKVDQLNTEGKQVLFINQRHLISMHMLNNVTLIPEYEREELMEMAMAQNKDYLQQFRQDLVNHRFGAIVVDPLRFNYFGEEDAMGAENNAWSRYVVKSILCSYQLESSYAADRVAIYVPQTGPDQCP